ncbi:MAG TPA: uracil-DNA glycosylase, partial [Bifidobacterium animalis]|nr:uracil-DNA glycosylase [Bifidobacterium animalis]
MTEIKPLEELMDPGWAEALRPVEPQIRHMGRLLRERIGHGEHIAPASRN